MKKLFCIFCVLAILLIFSSCTGNGSTHTADQPISTNASTSGQTPETTEPPATTEPQNTEEMTPADETEIKFVLVEPSGKGTPNRDLVYTTNISKDHVAEFIELLGDEVELGGLLSGYALDEEHCYNVTPDIFSYMTDMKIFKFSDSCAAFLLLDGEIYPLCEFFGGYGFVDALPWDFDEDGKLDLLISSSWGSGMHRSILSVFNTTTKETTILFDSSTTDTPNMDVYAIATIPASFAHDPVWRCSITVYTIALTVNDQENFGFANLSWNANEALGYIYLDNGTPTFAPWE